MIQKLLIAISKIINSNRNSRIYKDDFDDCAQTYDTVVTRRLLGKYSKALLDELDIKSGARCIDLGCGTGHAIEMMAPHVEPDGFILG